MVLVMLGYLLTLTLAVVAAVGGHIAFVFWAIAAMVTLAGAFPVVLSTVGSGSPGALDNASGVVTVIAAARQLGNISSAGILITDAEELGLAGARAWSRESGGRPATVLNCDGVDDSGNIQVMFSGRRSPAHLLGAVDRATGVTGIGHQAGRLIPGVLTDSVAFTDAGFPSVTFARGSLRSLLRVHTSRDDLAHIRGTGIAETATLMAATVRELGEMR
jgi:Zn-dependent M28 family amino/carboxypeptidase